VTHEERHEERCQYLLDTTRTHGGSLQRLMWMKRDAERRVRTTWTLKEQNESANDFHAFDAAIKAIKAIKAMKP
jgi:hypothetical protein